MYAVEVSDHIMIAHSFRGEVFGPAQRLHGATFAVSAAFMAKTLDANGIVVDIGRAFDVLKEVLAPLNYRNLDDIVAFRGVNTTTEFLTRHVFDALAAAVKAGKLGRDGYEIDAIRVTVGEIADGARLVRGSAVVALGFAVPGSLDQPTGGYAYDRRLIAALRALGCEVDVIDLGDGFPYPCAATRQGAWERLRAVPAGRPIVIDGLALGVLPEAAAALAPAHPLIALVHHPLALESGITAETAAALAASERAALACVRHVVTTSPSTRRALVADYAVGPEQVTVALPGIDAVAVAPRPRRGTLTLLAVGAVVPRKGYDVLVDALAALTDLQWRLVIAGDRTRDPATADAVAAQIAAEGLGARVSLRGAVGDDELARLHAEADVFVLASRHEGYGMAFAEAINHGLPVVGTRAGAIPETVPAGAGILVEPDDAPALSAALRTMIADARARETYAAAARAAAANLPRWDATARVFLRVIEGVS